MFTANCRVRYRKVRLFVMKFGITNYEVIRLTGIKHTPKDICIARIIGTWKATNIHIKRLSAEWSL
ncbi:hypothetical protein B4918_31420 (plasmid) [Bacillus thuringiensis]|uniref:Uncharacterized protein n=1 Tax=Bacillus thuringiensis TaxID=1428 RepID=A0A9W3XMG4_BACTU|nr:hypothetical protein B4918_11420 [Bacillus thuringiensis]AQY42718.1 hypothetical protein B4918_31420 [Bacillus thuringiensis]